MIISCRGGHIVLQIDQKMRIFSFVSAADHASFKSEWLKMSLNILGKSCVSSTTSAQSTHVSKQIYSRLMLDKLEKSGSILN